jgi:chromosome segregation ATPase
LTGFPRSRYDRSKTGGVFIPDGDRNDYDFERLERGVHSLLHQQDRLQSENAELRRKVSEKNLRIRHLDEKLLQANQRRQDVGKSLDELIAHIDQLDAHFESQEKD